MTTKKAKKKPDGSVTMRVTLTPVAPSTIHVGSASDLVADAILAALPFCHVDLMVQEGGIDRLRVCRGARAGGEWGVLKVDASGVSWMGRKLDQAAAEDLAGQLVPGRYYACPVGDPSGRIVHTCLDHALPNAPIVAGAPCAACLNGVPPA